MLRGVAIFEKYEGEVLDATEFCLHPGNMTTRGKILDSLRDRFRSVSAHLPPFLPVGEVEREVAFDDGRVDYFTCHVTKRSRPEEWRGAWRDYARCGRRLLFENHNQDWHPTDAGICWPDEFAPIVDAGHRVCLDVGHILYACSFKVSDASAWADMAEKTFERFLEMPIGQVHVHTVCRFGGEDHHLTGFDVGPWLKRIAARHPDVVMMLETGNPQYTHADKVAALERWLA